MKLLTFLARRFRFETHARTLESVPEVEIEEEVRDAVVVFFHAESRDEDDRPRTLRRAAKHVKWLAGKRDLKRVVLHSFTHLGGETADPEFASSFTTELRERLESVDYEVTTTPFGHVCAWDLEVYGESLAKVWKEF